MSGGAAGITAHLARSLAPFRPRLVFLGRTPLNPGINPGTSPRAVEMAQTLADLHAAGIEAAYHTCDVTDPEAVRMILGEVASRYGKIDGIIHGAGVLRDGLLSQMTGDDLSMVTDVKFLGAWNLFSAAEGAGLRFFVGLSSGAMILGNPGQSNYAAANRMMSALLRYLGRKNRAIRFKALMLPPVEGAGMADDPAVRELMRRKGVAYVQVNELAGLFCRELSVAPADDDWVMFMRTLPAVKTAQLDATIPPALAGELAGGAVAFSPEDFPLIDRIARVDLRREQLEAFRTFSPEKDLWIEDHRPLKFVAHPLVSAAMVLETFMEAARLLYPHLAGARSSPGALPGHDRMSAWGAADGENLLPPSRPLPAGGMVRGLSLHPGDLPHRQIDGPVSPRTARARWASMAGEAISGRSWRIFRSGWTSCRRRPWIRPRCLPGTKNGAASTAGIG